MRSHPPTLTSLVRAALREGDLIPRGATVVVAVSGGPDSMALLHVLGGLRRRLAFGLFAHGVDHGLRPEASAELDVVERFAASLDVPFARTRVVVEPGANVQARARAARWEALHAAAKAAGADRVATGHHADDRAETFLMRILRGTTPRGLAVLPPSSVPRAATLASRAPSEAQAPRRIRPMIRARRADIVAHVTRHEIPYCTDPSNRDPRFLRVRLRQELLPVLERLSPRAVEHMCAIADGLGAACSACGASPFDALDPSRTPKKPYR